MSRPQFNSQPKATFLAEIHSTSNRGCPSFSKLGAAGTRTPELTSSQRRSLFLTSMSHSNFVCYAHALPQRQGVLPTSFSKAVGPTPIVRRGWPRFAAARCRRHKKLGVDVEPERTLALKTIVKRRFLVLRTRLASTASSPHLQHAQRPRQPRRPTKTQPKNLRKLT